MRQSCQASVMSAASVHPWRGARPDRGWAGFIQEFPAISRVFIAWRESGRRRVSAPRINIRSPVGQFSSAPGRRYRSTLSGVRLPSTLPEHPWPPPDVVPGSSPSSPPLSASASSSMMMCWTSRTSPAASTPWSRWSSSSCSAPAWGCSPSSSANTCAYRRTGCASSANGPSSNASCCSGASPPASRTRCAIRCTTSVCSSMRCTTAGACPPTSRSANGSRPTWNASTVRSSWSINWPNQLVSGWQWRDRRRSGGGGGGGRRCRGGP